jgi:hypothetical protein
VIPLTELDHDAATPTFAEMIERKIDKAPIFQ